MSALCRKFWCNCTLCIILGGTAVMISLIEGLSVELATALVVAVMFTYTYIGCLGATFYVSYFNTSIIFIIMLVFLVKVYNDDSNRNPLGKKTLNCIKVVEFQKLFGLLTPLGTFSICSPVFILLVTLYHIFVHYIYFEDKTNVCVKV